MDFATSSVWGGNIIAVNDKIAMMPIVLGTSDFLVHHIHAFTIHVTVLILLKVVGRYGPLYIVCRKTKLGYVYLDLVIEAVKNHKKFLMAKQSMQWISILLIMGYVSEILIIWGILLLSKACYILNN